MWLNNWFHSQIMLSLLLSTYNNVATSDGGYISTKRLADINICSQWNSMGKCKIYKKQANYIKLAEQAKKTHKKTTLIFHTANFPPRVWSSFLLYFFSICCLLFFKYDPPSNHLSLATHAPMSVTLVFCPVDFLNCLSCSYIISIQYMFHINFCSS